MDVAGISMAMAQMDISSRVGVAMLDKTLDNAEAMGDQMLKIMDAAAMEVSVNPSVGSNFDMRI